MSHVSTNVHYVYAFLCSWITKCTCLTHKFTLRAHPSPSWWEKRWLLSHNRLSFSVENCSSYCFSILLTFSDISHLISIFPSQFSFDHLFRCQQVYFAFLFIAVSSYNRAGAETAGCELQNDEICPEWMMCSLVIAIATHTLDLRHWKKM